MKAAGLASAQWFGARCTDGNVWLVAAIHCPSGVPFVPPWHAYTPDPADERVAGFTGWNARAAVASVCGSMAWEVVEIIDCAEVSL